ncbi:MULTISPECIES: flagellar biosynthesis protein FliQ [Halobacillus]|uniref:Flagellar biosynthetic protein FliQ n=1 Tax=Halobacillus halophilus (strain ATCC 35676 / DSM 2266 / JCM 20832 / KCTC 3685 / LMG 17431 / NBRC 102448 / NCIMB 2269) TaxID=866895 RepID=I0JMM6_HALH3|nr:flagellar biosynthesis protein FliQ [Halobacillus halophilus]ASF39477.1 flagellar export apparatus protein FliQ [Halobacillus halophilus]CCG45396.1 flagellar biosynthesis protein [Halobacillus halophilus DSM 2266]
MNDQMVISFAKEGIYTVLMITGPLLILALAVGLLVSIFQATTQIQEQTLAFIPKIVAVMVGLIFFGPWMLTNMVEFAAGIFSNLNMLVG